MTDPDDTIRNLAELRDFLPLLPRQRKAMKTVWEQWDYLEQLAKAEDPK